jgi:type II secretory pathway component GspD/PulD (secretin)
MRVRSWMAFAIVFGACSAALAGDAARDAGKANAAASPKWEYKILTKDGVADLGKGEVGAGLNALGDDSWELIAVEPGGRSARESSFYFKRPVQAAAPSPDSAEFLAIQLKYADAAEAAKALDKVFDGGAGRIRVVADPRANQLLIKASAIDWAAIRVILQRLDVPTGK